MNASIVVAISYVLGCFSTAYYLFRFSTGQDIRSCGSGNAGARNIGRELGAPAFVVTFVIDGGKGFLAIALADYFQLGEVNMILSMIAVVVGHIWPAQLGFRGGKGVATAIGAIAGIDVRILIPSIINFAIASLVAKDLTENFTVAGLLAIAISPIAAAILHQSAAVTAGISILAALIIFAHRKNLREVFTATTTTARSGKVLEPQVQRRHL
jgi:glycerol-3-phosphate acyltransferase PlsY